MTARWLYSGDMTGFFVMLFMLCMVLLRWRFPKSGVTVVIDCWVCAVFFPVALALPLFWAMYYRADDKTRHRVTIVLCAAVFLLPIAARDFDGVAYAALGAVAGLFLGLWEREYRRRFQARDTEAGRYYRLESLQSDLFSAAAQIERMTALSERARIARDIHDNAGHDIVAAYISLQSVREELAGENVESLSLFDAALERLGSGANKIREAVHNLAPIAAPGINTLEEICKRFPNPSVRFSTFGDTNPVPVHIWNTLESVLSESLTNAARHTKARTVSVSLDATPKLVRLCVENDGVSTKKPNTTVMGAGLRNLRYRASAIGGSLAVSITFENVS
ncbi:MAG: histidine kinase [Defluviitaleaceae bacterium]|nr:histidine kinase [Defluviitaleaceae bacterium]